MKKKLITLLQLTIGAGLIAFFFLKIAHSGKLDEFKTALQSAAGNWPLLTLGTALYFVCMCLCTLRWRVLLQAQNVHLSFSRTLVLYFIGHFFSSFMPGATSGDIIKAYYASKETPNLKTEVVSTVFIDRIAGLVGLIVLSVIMMAARFNFFLAYKETRYAMVFNLVLLVMALAGFFVIFRRNLLEKSALFSKLEAKTKVGSIITKVYNAFHVCVNHPGVMSKTIAYSVVNHVFFVSCAALIGMSLGIKMTYIDYLAVFPVINAIAAIPITPGGLGTREGAAIFLLGALNVPAATALAVSLLLYTATLFWALMGGLVYMAFVYTTGYNVKKDMAEEQKAEESKQ